MARTNGGTLTTGTITYLQSNKSFRFIDLIKIEFTSGNVYYTNAHKAVTYLTNPYTNSDLMGLDAVTETLSLKIRSVSFELTTVNTNNITPAFNTNFEGVPVTIYKAILDTDDTILHSWITFQGELESFELDETQADSVIRWTATDRLVIYDRLRSRRTNDQEQQTYFSGDLGLEFVGQYMNLSWGRKDA